MKKLIIAIIVLITFVVMYLRFAQGKPPPLPHSLVAIQCQQDSKYIAAQGYDVYQADKDTTLFSPCTRPGSIAEYQRQAHALRYSDAPRGTIDFKRASDGIGTFMRTDDTNVLNPKIAVTAYTVNAHWALTEGAPWDASITGRDQIEIATPSAFSQSGPVTIFYCKDLHGAVKDCWARARSQTLFWRIQVVYGEPHSVRMPDMGLTEVYQLIADHILQKSNPKLVTRSATSSSSPSKSGSQASPIPSVVLSSEVDAQTLERYEASDAARKINATTPFGSASTADRVKWASERIPIPFDMNPYTTVLTITGHTRTDGAVRTNWRVGWLVDDRMQVLFPIKDLRSEPMGAGQSFTLTSDPIPNVFREGVRGVALVELLESDNAVIDKVLVQVTAGK
jgi:hypothetical protein